MALTLTASSSALSTIPEIGFVCLCGNLYVLMFRVRVRVRHPCQPEEKGGEKGGRGAIEGMVDC